MSRAVKVVSKFVRSSSSESKVHTSCRRTTEVNTDCRPCTALQAVQVCPVQDTVPHTSEQFREVGTTEVCAGLELGQRVAIGSHGVQHDVVGRVDVELLGQVGVDLQELNTRAAGHASSLGGLLLERGQQSLEPLERGGILANPEELDTAKTGWWVGTVAQVPNVLENGSPGSDTNTSTNQNSNLVLEHVLGGGSVRSIDLNRRHLLTVLQSDLIHSHGVDSLVHLSLSSASTDCVTKCASEVTDLTNVDRHIGIVGARGNGERVPLVLGNRGKLDEQPLSSLVLEGRLGELNLDHICYID